MEIKGYASIKRGSTTGISPAPIEDYEKAPYLRIIDINDEGDVLVIHPEGAALASFNAEDVEYSFRCEVINEIIVPPGLDFLQQMEYINHATNRIGGYSKIVAGMVIMASLHKNHFNDNFIWQKQPDSHKPPFNYSKR